MINLQDLTQQFLPITLAEMSSVKLMNRTDTKFVTTEERLCQFLSLATDDYFIQEIDGERNMEYDTTYWDTPQFDMYMQHQWGHVNRQKLRFRTYVSSHLQFMEVKTKNNHGRTKKKRIEVTDMDLMGDDEKLRFIGQHLRYDAAVLHPAIRNHFCRITLVNRAKTERLTIDSNLHFDNMVSGHTLGMGELVIIELKRDGICFSPVLQLLRQLRIHPHGFSKYCMGSALTNPALPLNRFKRKLIEINKIINSNPLYI